MVKLGKLMSKRTARKIDVELNDCRENLGTWFAMYSNLYAMKRELDKSSLTQTDRAVELVAKSFLKHRYAEELIYSESENDNDSDDSNDESDSDLELEDDTDMKTTQPNTRVLSPSDKEQIEKIKARHGGRPVRLGWKRTPPTSTEQKNTEFQNQAINVLTQHEDEQADLDSHMEKCRREMQADQQKANGNAVKFSLEVDKEKPDSPTDEQENGKKGNIFTIVTHDGKADMMPKFRKQLQSSVPVPPPRPDNLEVEDCEVMFEEEVDENDAANTSITLGSSGRVLSDEEIAKLAAKCVSSGMIISNDNTNNIVCGQMNVPLGQMNVQLGQTNIVTKEPDINELEKRISGTMLGSTAPGTMLGSATSNTINTASTIKFVTDTGEPPVVSALLKISPADRDKLYEKMYNTAKTNVTRQLGSNNTSTLSQERINELIRNESDRLLQVYKETH